jgi:type IV pilus assembly protein PilB
MDIFDVNDPARLDDYLSRLADGLDPRLGNGRTPSVDLRRISPDPQALAQIPGRAARHLRGLPLRRHGHLLAVAMAHPDDAESRQSMGFLTDCTVIPFATDEQQLAVALADHYDRQEDAQIARDLGLDGGERSNEPGSPIEMERIAGQAPIIRLINEALADATARRASDVHLRPGEHHTELLYRIDDELVPVRRFLPSLLPALVSRIKVIGRMNLAEHRTAQDGRTTFTLPDGRNIDLRISVLPSIHGESVAIRLLDTSQGPRSLDRIGLSTGDRERLDDIIGSDHGLFLICGPTGCGKTTTLYAILQALARQRINILTIEDPVEYRIDGLQQMQVNRAAGFTFAKAMRNFLRHDPDVIMVGEIRDRETAEIAIESALTGHLVFSTLHTNTAATAVTRLLDLGVEPYLLRASLLGAMSQRLVRKLCPACKEVAQTDMRIAGLLGLPADGVYWRGKGCSQCEGLGVRGRKAVYELMRVTGGIMPLIHTGAEADRIHSLAVSEGMVPLTATATALATAGEISLEEAFRTRMG